MGANDESTKASEPADSLSRVLGHSLHAKALVEECADDLASVNSAMAQALAASGQPHVFVGVLGQTAALAEKVKAVAVALSAANRMLEAAIRDRTMNLLRFAAVEEQEHSARHAALHDVLTGLPNRALFNDRLDQGLAQARRHGWTLAVMFVDLDAFKAINDTYGHEAGDSVLQAIARRLKASARGEDTVSRQGGDEFLYLLTGIRDEANISKIAEKIVEAVQAPCVIRLRDTTVSARVKASIGIAIFPKHGDTVQALIHSADEAMYRAKEAKSGVAFATAQSPE
jgi:diguanylate cyclase (GGDEF)-like protein